MKQDENAKYM